METLFLLFCVIQLSASIQNASFLKNDTLVSLNHYHEGGSHESDRSSKVKEMISDLATYLRHIQGDTPCKLHSSIVIEEAGKLNVRALKIIDSTAKLPSGILSGNLNQFGDFDECVTAKFQVQNESIKGKYCLSTISIKFINVENENVLIVDDLIHSHRMFTNELNDVRSLVATTVEEGGAVAWGGHESRLIRGDVHEKTGPEKSDGQAWFWLQAGHRIPKFETFNWGVCLPHSCTNFDLEKALSNQFDGLLGTEFDIEVNESMCFEEGQRKFNAFNAGAILLFVFVILLTSYSTVIDTYEMNTTNLRRYLKCFSLKSNLSVLFKTDSSRDEIRLLHGARFLNAMALLLSHKQMALLFNPVVNRTEMAESLGKPWSMIGRCAILYTDSFILISGLLISHSLVKELDERGRINFRERLVTRLFRFTPSLFAVILFCTFVMEYLGSGPQWGLVVQHYADLCKQNMWQNFFYVHNFFGFENMCLTHTHQLGIDMQLFLISPILIYMLWKNRKQGILLLLTLAVTSTFLRYYVTIRQQLSTLIYYGISVDRLWKTASLSYILPTHRLTVYVAGLALGYYLRRGGDKLKIPYAFKWIGWIVAISSGLLAVFGPYHVSSRSYSYDPVDSALYNAFSPILWLVFLVWSVIACQNGWGGWFHGFLSWKYFAIFTRISYAVYLTQFPVFFYGVGTQRTQISYKGFHSLIDLSEFLLIFSLSVILTLLFDLPFQNLRTYVQILKKERKKEVCFHPDHDPTVVKSFERKRLKSHGY